MGRRRAIFFKKKKAKKEWSDFKPEDRAGNRMRIRTICEISHLGKRHFCRLADLSITGVGLICPWPLKDGEVVLVLRPPEDELKRPVVPIEWATCELEICHARPHGEEFRVGARFIEPSERFLDVVYSWFRYFGENWESPKKSVED